MASEFTDGTTQLTDRTQAAAPPAAGAGAGNRILTKMLDRLFASLVNGPSLNCRPHNSRQRVDFAQLGRLKDRSPEISLTTLIGEERKIVLKAKAPQPKRKTNFSDAAATEADAALSAAERAWSDQQALLTKLHTVAEDARTYEQDTGVHVLNVGFPLLSLPPGTFGASSAGGTRRILAPVAFIPVTLTIKRGSVPSVEIACRGEGIDLVTPNAALLAWLEQQTGIAAPKEAKAGEMFADEAGDDPGREIAELVRHVCKTLEIPVPRPFGEGETFGETVVEDAGQARSRRAADEVEETVAPEVDADVVDVEIDETTALARPVSPQLPPPEHEFEGEASDAEPALLPPLKLAPAPRADETPEKPTVLFSAVLGLFPIANQGLLRDMQAMVGGESLAGPVESFIRLGVSLDAPSAAVASAPDAPPLPVEQRTRSFESERMVSQADPCQSRAVRLARESRGLVVHGPPGTGKSQTITNVIGDHLARGQRVLLVCEKRTALDVVANRLKHMGLGNLVAIVHDPQRDQRELYRGLRQQLDDLPEAKAHPRASARLAKVDDELQALHAELTSYQAALSRADAQSGLSFHDLVGQWLATSIDGGPTLSGKALAGLNDVRLSDLEARQEAVREILRRALDARWAKNPWSTRTELSLPQLLSKPTDWYRTALGECVVLAQAADATADAEQPPFAAGIDLKKQADARVALAAEFDAVLDMIAPEAVQRWASRTLSDVQAARAKLNEAAAFVQALKAGPPDPELLATVLTDRGALPSLNELAANRTALQKYAEGYATWSAWVARVRQGAPRAKLSTIARWVDADQPAFAVARKAFKEAEPLAERVAAAPLDRELSAAYKRQPFAVPQIRQWIGVLDAYGLIAGSLLSFLHGGTKRAALPPLQHFGLQLAAGPAQRVRTFLADLLPRIELRDAVVSAAGSDALPAGNALPDDAELLSAFEDHHSTLESSADLDRDATAADAAAAGQSRAQAATVTDPNDLVHRLLGPELQAATPLFDAFGLFPNPANTERVRKFLQALTVRQLLQDFHVRLLGGSQPEGLMADAELEGSMRVHTALLDLILRANREPALAPVAGPLRNAMSDAGANAPAFLAALRRAPARVDAVLRLESKLAATGTLTAAALAESNAALRAGEPVADDAQTLAAGVGTLEAVVRVQAGLAELPPALRFPVSALLDQSAGADDGLMPLRRAVLAAEIGRRLAADPLLQNVDGQRIATAFERYRALDDQKKTLVRDAILDQWVGRQKDRLVADSGNRLSAAGADLRRRLTLRGERAMRLRQVIAVGRKSEGGDPLFDLCPVWMVSPETAAQIFPREPVFHVVVFDEASQCRLEEALPVLTRGERVLIAGDPKQLPPTRFFESAVSQSEEGEIETDQDLFETQQGEVEDLLAAALSLDIQQCYLDVHYRSRNADLIAFSNEHFYGSRLQPLPGHPSRVAPSAPVRLHRIDGTYADRANEGEADAVVALVRELLDARQPPSIGIACFNLQQRDLIVEKLDDAAEADERFGKRLSAARTRTGAGSFEGLFVKNLENVQGDERDHIIISTTYGPDAKGRFYRRFGPVGRAGGGRRLNVLVTRARDAVHLMTSIPASEYRSLPALEAGQSPGGAWLLFAYLKYAEDLSREYARGDASEADGATKNVGAETMEGGAGASTQALAVSHTDKSVAAPAKPQAPDAPRGESNVPKPQCEVRVRGTTRTPSPFAEALARRLAKRHVVGSDVYWGNDGFCVDLALHHPRFPDDRTVGVLCDAARFAGAEDAMEWDVFRTGILEGQGWRLLRLWTPHYFRDPAGATAAVLAAAAEVAGATGAE